MTMEGDRVDWTQEKKPLLLWKGEKGNIKQIWAEKHIRQTLIREGQTVLLPAGHGMKEKFDRDTVRSEKKKKTTEEEKRKEIVTESSRR